jgi:hypothetical protein
LLFVPSLSTLTALKAGNGLRAEAEKDKTKDSDEITG